MYVYDIPVHRVGGVWILLEELWEDALVRERTSNGEGISYYSPLRLSVQSHDLAHIMDKSDEVEPPLVRMGFSDPLCCLVGMEAVGKTSLMKGEKQVQRQHSHVSCANHVIIK